MSFHTVFYFLNCSITLYITVNKKTVIFRSKTVYTGPLPQLYGSFLHIFQLRSFQIIILQTFLIAIIINNNIGKYLLTRQNIKKERNCKFLVKGHYFKIGLIPKVISIRKIPFGQMRFIDKSILCQTFINFEATYQFLGIFKNNRFFSLFHNFYQVNFELSPLLLLI
jgi:hypothetical protein